MINAFIIPGFHPNRIFADSGFDLLRERMQQSNVYLEGVEESWANYSITEYGLLACSQLERRLKTDVLIGHSVGAIAALSVK